MLMCLTLNELVGVPFLVSSVVFLPVILNDREYKYRFSTFLCCCQSTQGVPQVIPASSQPLRRTRVVPRLVQEPWAH